MRDDLETTPVHRSLLTPVLILGVERGLVIPLVGVTLALLFVFRLNLVTPTLAVLLVTVGLPWMRRLSRRDPWAFRVLRRHVRIAGFYRPLPRHDVRRSSPPTV